ncbi:ABC transporter permease [Litorivicinus lipolyticus]|uniref:Transport permease protein n=1 Tax=Litorivicinus lipolyticus TaxID=418701 RepID=A0A5Q2QBN1_9GAMM|nr:ABC transporter permease [Litorivicinus lipolyticus]QGG80504.1 ABC transporter permease [Litorivicinus lipolyticus]
MNAMWLTAFRTILRREIVRFTRIWVQTLVPPAITMTLYFVIFGSLIGRRIGDMGGMDYMTFIVPGLIMMSVITNSYANVSSSFFSAKFQNFIEEMLVAAVPEQIILWGYICAGVVRGLLVGSVVVVVSLFFTDLNIHSYPVVILVGLMTAILFSIMGFINGVFANSFDDISIVPTFVLTPLTYLGGVFFSVSLLPGFWQHVALANPILYMVNAFRYGMLGQSDIGLGVALSLMTVFTVAAYFYANYLLKRGAGVRK